MKKLPISLAVRALAIWPIGVEWVNLKRSLQLEIESLLSAHHAQQEALFRARRSGLSLNWLMGWDHLNLSDIAPVPPRNAKSGRNICLASEVRESKSNSMGFNGLRVSRYESPSPSPSWENAVRVLEDAA